MRRRVRGEHRALPGAGGEEENLPTITALMPAIGYDASAALAKQALAEDRPLRDVAKTESGLSEEEVDASST